MDRESVVLDELDLKVVNALQINPRAPWSLVGAVLEVDPATAARRWSRLTELGAAWITCYAPMDAATVIGLIEIDCAHGCTTAVAEKLAQDPNIITLNITAGQRDIIAEVLTHDARGFARYAITRLAEVDGILRVRSVPVARVYFEASRWRLGSLDATAERRLAPDTTPAPLGEARRPVTGVEREVADQLAADPRIRVAELAATLSISPATARRRLTRVLARQQMLRCELARTLSEWPVYATFFANCPADRVEQTAQALSRLPEVRFVASTAGPHNLFIAVWLRSLAHVQALEMALAAQLPHVTVVDRAVVLRPVKLMGRLLDEDGWAVGWVPPDPRPL